MRYKRTPQCCLSHRTHFTSLCTSVRLFTFLFGFGLMIILVSGCAPPIIHAARRNNVAKIKSLLDKGADINTRDSYSQTPLHFAASSGHKALASLLLSKGADVDAKSKFGATPLHFVCANGNLELVNLLLEHGANVNSIALSGITPILNAFLCGHKEIVELLLKKGADVNVSSKFNFTIAEKKIYKYGFTLLQLASDLEITSNCKGAIAKMTSTELAEYAELFIEYGADINAINEDGKTSLMLAAKSGYAGIVDLLINKGAPIDTMDNDGNTSLLLAAYNGHKDIVTMLVTRGADINMQNKLSRTALHAAAINDQEEIADYLIRPGTKLYVIEKDEDDVYATAVIYELCAKYYGEEANYEKVIEHIEVAAKYYEEASRQCKRAADKIGRAISLVQLLGAAVSAGAQSAAYSTVQPDMSPSQVRKLSGPQAAPYSYSNANYPSQKQEILKRRSAFCRKRATLCDQVLKCCQEAKIEADLQECLRNLRKD